MKRYIKFFIYGIIYLILILIFAVMFIVTTRAEIIKPNNGIEPYQVVKIQLRGLKAVSYTHLTLPTICSV